LSLLPRLPLLLSQRVSMLWLSSSFLFFEVFEVLSDVGEGGWLGVASGLQVGSFRRVLVRNSFALRFARVGALFAFLEGETA
jgi:hypothetical protein